VTPGTRITHHVSRITDPADKDAPIWLFCALLRAGVKFGQLFKCKDSQGMKSGTPAQFFQLITAGMALLLLACAPANRLAELSRDGRALATSVAIVNQGDLTVLSAYKRLDKLPGYRLESHHITKNGTDIASTVVVISEHDVKGNHHTTTQTPDGQLHEIYQVGGHNYAFSPHYNGWVDTATDQAGTYRSAPQINNPHQWLEQFGVIPVETGRETIQARFAIRYKLQDVVTQLAEGTGNAPAGDTSKLRGTLWVDEETGALLKSEILLFEDESRQPVQELLLAVTNIGNIQPILPPSPIANPGQIVSATATAQAWSVLQVTFNFQGQSHNFELVPVNIRQTSTGTNGNSAEMTLILRNLPANLLVEPERERFLTQLGAQLSLSIPKHNLTTNSQNFRLENKDISNQSLEVVYIFDAILEDFRLVEMILASPGNPIFAPVPVADYK